MNNSLSLVPRIRSALFEIATQPPAQAPRWTLKAIIALFALLLIWAWIAKLDIVAVAPGRLVPKTYVKIIQPAQAGIVKELLVKEGDEVEPGQVLIRLDATEVNATDRFISQELARQRLQLRRIDAELNNTTLALQPDDDSALFQLADAQRGTHHQAHLDAVAQQKAVWLRAEKDLSAAMEVLKKLERTGPSYQRSAAAYERLAKDKLVGELQAEEMQRTSIEKQQDLHAQQATVDSLHAAVNESRQALAQLNSRYHSDLQTERQQVLSKLTQLEQEQVKTRFQQSNLELKAPQAGTVKELATTTIGAVVQPGSVLISLVPKNEPLIAEVMIDNQDIGFIHPGQTVRLKLATYPFQQYGMLDGVVDTVIADSDSQSTRPTGQRSENTPTNAAPGFSFKATIRLEDQALRLPHSPLPLVAGMQLSAEIIEGKRSVMQYLLSPVQKIASESAIER